MKTKMKNTMIAAMLIATVAACDEEDTGFLIPKGEINEVHVENSAYTHQTYFDLSSNSEVLSVEIADWDLEVETSGKMEMIKLNPAGSYRVFKTTSTDINDVITLPAIPDWTFDNPSGSITGMSFHNWNNNEVYVIGKKEASFDPTAPSIVPFAKISFVKTSNGITVKWKRTDESTVSEFTLKTTSSSHPYTWFSFETKGEATTQPPSPDDYDLIITSYTGAVSDGAMSYIFELRGALTNRVTGVASYRYNPGEADDDEYIEIFNNLTTNNIEVEKYKVEADAIGYDWKSFSRATMSYEIDKSNMFFVRDNDGNNYKLRFTNYYNTNGDKGYISFTYALL